MKNNFVDGIITIDLMDVRFIDRLTKAAVGIGLLKPVNKVSVVNTKTGALEGYFVSVLGKNAAVRAFEKWTDWKVPGAVQYVVDVTNAGAITGFAKK